MISQPFLRPEHPRPQMTRPTWRSLNGSWDFVEDFGHSGFDRKFYELPPGKGFGAFIQVPFCRESPLSGIGHKDFCPAVWYRNAFLLDAKELRGRTLLHFGAVDYKATVYVNGKKAGVHLGGYVSFTVDITRFETPGENSLVVAAEDDSRSGRQPAGKQSGLYQSYGCLYTRTTGIWQSVWLEFVPERYITRYTVVPNPEDESAFLTVETSPGCHGMPVEVRVSREGAPTVTESAVVTGNTAFLKLPVKNPALWDVGQPNLYDLRLRLGEDEVEGYFGMRSVALTGNAILLNGRPVFQRLVLDQGYWPDTLLTAPSDEALARDIELALDAGFNGARIHQRVPEERFYYHADRLGYLVWGEFGDWGVQGYGPPGDNQRPPASFLAQWVEAVRRDRNHPSIVGWCPLNETYQVLHDRITQLDDVTAAMYWATKAADPTRPVIDASGYSHRVRGVDVYDSHSYEQDPAAFRAEQAGLAEGRPFANRHEGRAISLPFEGQPYFVSEYGGIWWNAELAAAGAEQRGDDESWGYGERVRTAEEWQERFAGLTQVLLDDPLMFGYCYTQLTDTFQEENGLYDFRRHPKHDMERIRRVQTQRAAYEGDGAAADEAGAASGAGGASDGA